MNLAVYRELNKRIVKRLQNQYKKLNDGVRQENRLQMFMLSTRNTEEENANAEESPKQYRKIWVMEA